MGTCTLAEVILKVPTAYNSHGEISTKLFLNQILSISGPKVLKPFFMLNSAEHKILTAHIKTAKINEPVI